MVMLEAAALRTRLGSAGSAPATGPMGFSSGREHQFGAQSSDWRVAKRQAAAIKGGEIDHD
jgi:hypothetical protein